MSLMGTSVIFLAAAVVAVPLFQRFKLGAVLGYLIAGVAIGPHVMNWVSDADTILHFAELGVVLLLFIIGLELHPAQLLKMRNQILLTGGGQLMLTALLMGALAWLALEHEFNTALIIGLAVALSSTAFAVQLMNEHKLFKSPPGQAGFAILLMQDLAVIPILLLVASMAPQQGADAPAWWVSVLAVLGVLLVGRYLLNPFLQGVSRWGNAEIMTAAALLIVLTTAVGMQQAGLSMGMGAFLAGLLLANSSFRHQLETEIAPFKGLLLGLFFIAIGMHMDLSLLFAEPVFILSAALALVAVKSLVIYGLLRLAKHSSSDAMRIGLMLSQGGEFAFVVMTQATASQLIGEHIAAQVTLIVGVSMALTAPLVILYSQYYSSRNCPPAYDSQSDTDEPQVMIAGFGRFGQISGRILAANSIPFVALDKDADHIAFVNQFGNKIFYGDASRLDLLKTAGIAHIRILLIAIDSDEDGLRICELVHQHYPEVTIIARVRNRQSVSLFNRAGAHSMVREVYNSSLLAAEQVLREYGVDEPNAQRMVRLFDQHDNSVLQDTLQEAPDIQEMIARNARHREQLHSLFEQDRQEM